MMEGQRDQVSESQWATLAALRFFLAVVVVLGHYVYFIADDSYHLFDATSNGARSAVWGFFILSGFSIAASLKRDAIGFYRRRIIRIYPIYLTAICIGLMLYAANIVPTDFHFPLRGAIPFPSLETIFGSLLMLQTIVGVVFIVWPSWSLAIEWWLYMVAPLFRRCPDIVLVVLAAISWGLYIKLTSGPVDQAINSVQFGWRALSTAWFWLIGFLYYRLNKFKLKLAVLVGPVLLAILLHRFIGSACLIVVFALMASSFIAIEAPLRSVFNWLGDLSYPIYLFHGMVLVGIVALGHNNEVLTLGAVLATSIAVLHLVDYPLRRSLKTKLGVTRIASSS